MESSSGNNPNRPEDGLRIAFVCHRLDETDAATAARVRWVEALARHPRISALLVVAYKAHAPSLEALGNVQVRSLGGGGRRRSWFRFYRELFRARGFGWHFFFVHHAGFFVTLLFPIRLFSRTPVYQWKAHPVVTWRISLYTRLCDDLVFVSTPEDFEDRHRKVRVVGHGIDTQRFAPADEQPTRDLVVVGRLTPIKRIDRALRVVAECRSRYGRAYSLDIIGPEYVRYADHAAALRSLVQELDLASQVRFVGPVPHGELSDAITRYRAAVNLSETAFDKSVGEMMAAGIPCVSANPAVAAILPADLRATLVVDADDVGVQAEAVHRVLSLEEDERRELGTRLRDTIVADHSLDTVFDRILAEIDCHRDGRRSRRPGGPLAEAS